MITSYNAEKKTPITVLEAKIESKTYQYAMDSDSPLDDCLNALEQIRNHITEIKQKVESERQEEPKAEA